MAQAFVRKVFNERKTESTIQVPDEASTIDEENVKEVLDKATKDFFDSSNSTGSEENADDALTHRLASHVSKILVKECVSVKDHKIVVHVFMAENWGQGMKVTGRCLWNPKCDRVVSVNRVVRKQICTVSAYFSKIPDDSSDDEEFSDNDDLF